MAKNQLESTDLLNPSNIEKWFTRVESSLQSGNAVTDDAIKSELATDFLARFGLQTPKDVITFLKSESGKVTIAMINEENERLAKLHENQVEMQREEISRERFLAFLLMALAYEEEAQKEWVIERNEETDKELQKQAEEARKHEQISQVESRPEKIIEQRIRDYKTASETLENVLERKNESAEALEQEMTLLEDESQQSDKKHELFEKSLEDILVLMTPPFTMDEMHTKVAELTANINKDADRVVLLLDSGHEAEARDLLNESTAQNIQVAAIKDMLSVFGHLKTMYTQSGEQTNSFADAYFIVSRTSKIVQHDNQFYLLPADQNDSIADLSPTHREEARLAFEKIKPEIMAVKHLVLQNKGLERSSFQHRRDSLADRSDTLQHEIMLLANQLVKMQAALATTTTALLSSKQSTPTAGPSTKPAMALKPLLPAASAPRPSPQKASSPAQSTAALTAGYRHILQLMLRNGNPPSRQSIRDLTLQSYDPKLQLVAKQLQPGVALTQNVRQQLDALAKQWGILPDPTHDALTPTDSATPQAPTPFGTWPPRPF